MPSKTRQGAAGAMAGETSQNEKTEKKMKVLSLFDGTATGLVALKRAGGRVETYYASEVDKYAMQIAKKNHPEIIHVGGVEKVWQEEIIEGVKNTYRRAATIVLDAMLGKQ